MAPPKGFPKPKGSGKPRGYKAPDTLAQQTYQEQFKARVQPEFAVLIEAAIEAAKGVSHMMAKDRDGKWTEVTDPAVMAKVLASGETFYRISARNPDVRALKDIFDRMCGCPTQALEVNVHGEVELVERLAKARQRGKG